MGQAAQLSSPIGLVAGNGNFPVEVAKRARELGLDVCCIAHEGETTSDIASFVSSCEWVKVGELGKIIKWLKNKHVREVTFVGGLQRPKLFKNFRPDLRAILMIARLKSMHDDAVLKEVAKEIEREGMRVFSAGDILSEASPKRGVLTSRKPSGEEILNAQIGWKAAKKLGELDIGQCAVVCRGVVVALEGIEGTDSTIKRAGSLVTDGGKCTVVKLSKPQQDLRMDIPAIGPTTIDIMVESKATLLVVEADKTIVFDPAETIARANKHGISIVSATGEGDLV